MLTTKDIISAYLKRVEEELKKDASAKGQKIPVRSFRSESDYISGRLYAAHYFRYLVTGRGPGKQPPPEAMLKFVQANPEILQSARQTWAKITEKSLAYLIGRKIGRQGTEIHLGKKPGIDLEKAIEVPKEDFLRQLAYHEAASVASKIRQAVAA